MKKIIIVIFLILLTGCNEKDELLEADKVNLNDSVIENKTIGNISTSDTSVIYNQGLTTFKVTLTNNAEEIYLNKIKVIFKTKNDSVITNLEGYIGQTLIDTTIITLTSDIDLTNAYSIEYNFE